MMFTMRNRLLYQIVVVITMQLIIATNASSQFNVRIGYSLGFVSPEITNNIVGLHNDKRALQYDVYMPSDDLNLMYGISLGVRYKIGISALELNWESLDRTLTSTGFLTPEPPLSKSSSSQELRYSLKMLMLTYETNFGLLGIGSSLGRNFVSIKETVSPDDKLPLLADDNSSSSQYFARFHLAFNFFGNNTVAFAIKPFIQFGLTDVDLLPLADNFSVSAAETNESFPLFGLSFAFYNGKQ